MSKSIQTDRLVLRRFRRADALGITKLLGNLSVSRWLTRVPHPYFEHDAQQFIDRHCDKDRALAITLSDEIVGCCAIGNELGYWIGQPFWGRGYVSEATFAMVTRYFHFAQTDLKSSYILGNSGSAKVLRKLGFAPTTHDEAVCASLGRLVTLQRMSLSQERWEARA
ncbi:hypothetical protein ROLI_020320 [Roseobacter fucihabitans]|uniref:N-acetyltransferase domain-containing protein n=1 Tax=Roseobacter fucihabitans TaxID=1537242 RepID=A0ABZ2BSL5_9RHOB|nr:GNAT family N-acetyltransferase [Roseobacter litoralis]MBC6966553.1 hypothetical protein [Roseobacter litoralis]